MLNVWPALLLVLLQGSLAPDDAGSRLALLRHLNQPEMRAAMAGYFSPGHLQPAPVAQGTPTHVLQQTTAPAPSVGLRDRIPSACLAEPAPGHSSALRWRDGPQVQPC